MDTSHLQSLSSKGVIFLTFLCKICLQIRYKMMGRLCFLFALCSLLEFYDRAFQAFLGFLIMDCSSSLKVFFTKCCDFGCGFFVFGCFSKVSNLLVVFLTFFLGFKVVQFGGQCKFRNGFSLLCSNDGVKKLSFKGGTTRVSNVSGNINNIGCGGDQKMVDFNEFVGLHCGIQKENSDCFVGDEGNDKCENFFDEDQVFDVLSLRKMVKDERRKANVAKMELEKERMAAGSAADEAMAMILRLQNEKSLLQMQVKQLQRLGEQRQLYDQDVIQSLQWIIMKHEAEGTLLDDQLKKLRLYVKSEELDGFDSAEHCA